MEIRGDDVRAEGVGWRDEATSLLCLIERSRTGRWFGYVAIHLGRPLYGLGNLAEKIDEGLAAYGGIAYSGSLEISLPMAVGMGIGSDEYGHLWWTGFDSRCSAESPPRFMKSECTFLARQLDGIVGSAELDDD